MKLHQSIKINGKEYPPGSQIPWYFIYPFFLVHMLAFGLSGFFLAYASDVPILFTYAHGGIAILVYLIFYLAIFGIDEVKWMLINAGLGILGLYTQIGAILNIFGKDISSYQWYLHITPFLYFTLYTFLLRQLIIDLTNSRGDTTRQKFVENIYLTASIVFYLGSYFF